MMKGAINAQVAADVNSKMEGAIEQLREKYEKKAEIERREAAVKAKDDRIAAGLQAQDDAQKAEEKAANDMTLDDPEMEALRRARLAALKDTAKAKKQHLDDGGGEVREIVEEEFLKEVTSTHLVLVHFYHDEFMKCKVMDKHLRVLAPKCVGTKILRLNATKAPFFVGKLKVQVLPTLIYFKDGIVIGRQTGFEGLVDDVAADDFSTARLQRAMKAAGILGKGAKTAEDDYDDEADDSSHVGAGGNFAQQLAAARRQMLEALDDEDDI